MMMMTMFRMYDDIAYNKENPTPGKKNCSTIEREQVMNATIADWLKKMI